MKWTINNYFTPHTPEEQHSRHLLPKLFQSHLALSLSKTLLYPEFGSCHSPQKMHRGVWDINHYKANKLQNQKHNLSKATDRNSFK